MAKLWNFKVPRVDTKPPKKLKAKKIFKSHKHEWEDLTNNKKWLKTKGRNLVGGVKRKLDNPNLNLLKLNKNKVKKFIRKEGRFWRCKKCGLIIVSDDMPDQDGATR